MVEAAPNLLSDRLSTGVQTESRRGLFETYRIKCSGSVFRPLGRRDPRDPRDPGSPRDHHGRLFRRGSHRDRLRDPVHPGNGLRRHHRRRHRGVRIHRRHRRRHNRRHRCGEDGLRRHRHHLRECACLRLRAPSSSARPIPLRRAGQRPLRRRPGLTGSRRQIHGLGRCPGPAACEDPEWAQSWRGILATRLPRCRKTGFQYTISSILNQVQIRRYPSSCASVRGIRVTKVRIGLPGSDHRSPGNGPYLGFLIFKKNQPDSKEILRQSAESSFFWWISGHSPPEEAHAPSDSRFSNRPGSRKARRAERPRFIARRMDAAQNHSTGTSADRRVPVAEKSQVPP